MGDPLSTLLRAGAGAQGRHLGKRVQLQLTPASVRVSALGAGLLKSPGRRSLLICNRATESPRSSLSDVQAASAGTYTLSFRYARGGTLTSRPLELQVNGTAINSDLAFLQT